MLQPEFDAEKFQELVLYIAQKSADDRRFGTTKLAKILCWSDFLSYAINGRPITGATYVRLEHGPVPEQLRDCQCELIERGDAELIEQEYYTYTQRRLLHRRQPDLSRFSGAEIALVDQIIDDLYMHNASEVSAQAHELMAGWRLASPGEVIPYETIVLSPDPLTDDDVRWGKKLAQEHGWLVHA